VKEFLAIVGPTASGKTSLSIELAKDLDAEIICMDSRQGYIGMDIGTDKVSKEIRRNIPHHGFDVRSPKESYSAGQFSRDAFKWINEIKSRERLPMLVGGTGFFLRAVTNPIFREPDIEESQKSAIRHFFSKLSSEEMERWVSILDPDRATIAIQGGTQRLVRTIEIALLTGRPLSWWHKMGIPDRPPMQGMIVLIETPREVLDTRINTRVDEMLEVGLVEEVDGLLASGLRTNDPGMTGTGYREIADYLQGRCSLEQALEKTKLSTRRYARRQVTWFKNQLEAGTLRVDGTESLDVQYSKVLEWWTETSGI